MRNHLFTTLLALTLLTGGCTDYFQGTTLVFEFEKLPVLHRIQPKDLWNLESNPTGDLCADDAYAAEEPLTEDDIGTRYQQPYEYQAWATINGSPVRLVRFTTRECIVNSGDTVIKNAITTVSYGRESEWGAADESSKWFGIINGIVSSVPSGGATMVVDVRLEQATEIFITREPLDFDETKGPQGTLLMRGELRHENQVLFAELAKISGSANGIMTAIPADRVSAW